MVGGPYASPRVEFQSVLVESNFTAKFFIGNSENLIGVKEMLQGIQELSSQEESPGFFWKGVRTGH